MYRVWACHIIALQTNFLHYNFTRYFDLLSGMCKHKMPHQFKTHHSANKKQNHSLQANYQSFSDSDGGRDWISRMSLTPCARKLRIGDKISERVSLSIQWSLRALLLIYFVSSKTKTKRTHRHTHFLVLFVIHLLRSLCAIRIHNAAANSTKSSVKIPQTV